MYRLVLLDRPDRSSPSFTLEENIQSGTQSSVSTQERGPFPQLENMLNDKCLVKIEGTDYLMFKQQVIAHLDGVQILPLKQSQIALLKKKNIRVFDKLNQKDDSAENNEDDSGRSLGGKSLVSRS